MTERYGLKLALIAVWAATMTLVSVAMAEGPCVTFVAGPVPVGAHWTQAGSPYCLDGDVDVVFLTIDPGVEVRALGQYEIAVSNALVANGTEQTPILFTGCCTDGACWRGLRFESAPGNSSLTHCIVERSADSGIRIINSEPFTMRHITLRNNYSATDGGGISIELTGGAYSYVLEDCTITNNAAAIHGGGLNVILEDPEAELVLRRCAITNNASNPAKDPATTRVGGGLRLFGNASIENSVISANSVFAPCFTNGCDTVAKGGGLFTDGVVSIDNSSIEGNYVYSQEFGSQGTSESAVSRGGGIHVRRGETSVRNSLIGCNTLHAPGSNGSRAGSGIALEEGSLLVENTTLTLNNYHAIWRQSGMCEVVNSILYFNTLVGGSYGNQISPSCDVYFSDVQQTPIPGPGPNINFNPSFTGGSPPDSCASDQLEIPGDPPFVYPTVDAGDPATEYNDVCFPPSRGTEDNDIGKDGGPGACDWLPYEVDDLRFDSSSDLIWTPIAPALTYSLYRGTFGATPWEFDHVCFAADLAGPQAPLANDDDTPAPGEGFYYLLAGRNANGDGTLGMTREPGLRPDDLGAMANPRPILDLCGSEAAE